MAQKLFYSQIVVVLLFVLAAIFTTPLLIPHFSSDTDRLCNINHWSNDSSINADYVFFGASSAMNGIAGDTISNLYNVSALSFTSVGQSLAESFLFYSRIHDDTKAVIQCVNFGALSSGQGINGDKVNRLIIDGYRMDSVTRTIIDESIPPLFDKSYIKTYFEVRSYIKTSIHLNLKQLMQPGQLREEFITDMKNAYLFDYERAPKEHFDKYLRSVPKEQKDSLDLSPTFVNMINGAFEYFESRGIKYYLVLLPVSSYTSKERALNYQEVLEKSALKCEIIDCSDLLEDDCFADVGHPNRRGASILSRFIMDQVLK